MGKAFTKGISWDLHLGYSGVSVNVRVKSARLSTFITKRGKVLHRLDS